MSEAALRFLIDSVGINRVVLGSDWPFVPLGSFANGMDSGLEEPEPGRKGEVSVPKLGTLLNL